MAKRCFIEVPKAGEEQVISAYITMPDLHAPYLTSDSGKTYKEAETLLGVIDCAPLSFLIYLFFKNLTKMAENILMQFSVKSCCFTDLSADLTSKSMSSHPIATITIAIMTVNT